MPRNTEEAVRQVERALQKARGALTVSDAASATGISISDAQDALEVLMNRYVCRLQVTESGEVLFDFGKDLYRRGSKSLGDHLRTLGAWLWKAFTVVFKIWITVMLVVYFILFVVLLLALLFAGRDSKKSIKLGWIGDLFADLFWISSRNMAIVYAIDADGYRHRSLQQRRRRKREETEPKKRLVQSVYDFVFGPPRPDFDPFANEKEVAAWLRENRGLLTMTEIVALAGWTFDEASERMADYLTRFKGEAGITDDGVLVGTFDRMLRSGDGGLEGGKIELFWDEYEAPYQLTGNSAGRNAAIIGMNAFNLVFASVILFSPILQNELGVLLGEYGISAGFSFSVLGVVPFLFSLIFFAVPLVRSLRVRRREAARIERNRRRRVLRQIFLLRGRPVTLDELHAAVNGAQMKPLTKEDVQRILHEMLPRFGGRSDIADDGTVLYRFERIAHEEAVAERMRAERGDLPHMGNVLFDTGSDAQMSLEEGKTAD